MAHVSRRYCRWFVSPTQMSFAVLRACRAGCRSWPVWLAVAATAVTKRDWSGSCCYIVCLHHSKKTAHQCRLFLELAGSTIHNPIRPDAGLNLDSHAQQASLQLPTCADNVGLLHTWTLLRCSSAHQHTASRPRHSGLASTPLAASTETSGVQDCMYGTPVAYVNSTDVPICRHSTRLWAWSTSSPLVFLQNTRCSTHAYHSRRHKFCCCRTACVEQFTGYYTTATDGLGNIWKHVFSWPRNRSALWLLIIALYTNTLTYLLTYLLPAFARRCCSSRSIFPACWAHSSKPAEANLWAQLG